MLTRAMNLFRHQDYQQAYQALFSLVHILGEDGTKDRVLGYYLRLCRKALESAQVTYPGIVR